MFGDMKRSQLANAELVCSVYLDIVEALCQRSYTLYSVVQDSPHSFINEVRSVTLSHPYIQ